MSAQLLLKDREIAMGVRDISSGGIFLYTSEPPVPVGEDVTIRLALTPGIKPVTVGAEVVRVLMASPEQGGGILGIGLHFHKISPDIRKQLDDLLHRAMLGVGTNGRAYPRVSCMMDVRFMYLTPALRRAVLRDVGEGGVGLFADEQVAKDSVVVVELQCDAATTLHLSGQVVSCEEMRGNKGGRYRIGVKFSGLAQEGRKDLQRFLKRLWTEQAGRLGV